MLTLGEISGLQRGDVDLSGLGKIVVHKGLFLEQIDRDMPMHRFGEPIELGAYCVFLASPAARMVTGTVCVSDGGLMCALG